MNEKLDDTFPESAISILDEIGKSESNLVTGEVKDHNNNLRSILRKYIQVLEILVGEEIIEKPEVVSANLNESDFRKIISNIEIASKLIEDASGLSEMVKAK